MFWKIKALPVIIDEVHLYCRMANVFEYLNIWLDLFPFTKNYNIRLSKYALWPKNVNRLQINTVKGSVNVWAIIISILLMQSDNPNPV